MADQLAELSLALLDFVEPLRRRLEAPDALEYLFYRYGWNATMDDAAFARFQRVATVVAPLEEFVQAAERARQTLAAGGDAVLDPSDAAALAESAGSLVRALAGFTLSDLSGLPDPFGRADFWDSIAEEVLDDLLEQYLRVYWPVIFGVLRLWRIVRYDETVPPEPGRVAYTRVWFDWEQAGATLENPLDALEQAYAWGDAAKPFQHQPGLEALRGLLGALRVPAALFAPSMLATAPFPDEPDRGIHDDVSALRVTLLERDFPDEKAFYRLAFEVFPAARTGEAKPTGLMVRPVLRGGADKTLPLSELLSFSFSTAVSSGDAIGFALFPGEAGVVGGAPALGTSVQLATTGTGPWYAVGNAHSSRIEVSGLALTLSMEGSVGDPEIKLHLALAGADGSPGCKAVVLLGDADQFVQGAVGSSALEFTFSPDVVWSSKSGLTFNGAPKVALDLPLAISLGPVTLTDATVALEAAPPTTSTAGVALRVGVGVRGALGPVRFTIAQLGFACAVTPYTRDEIRALPTGSRTPGLGSVDVDLRFAPPQGIGLSVDADVVSGGGFLEHSGDEYAGALDLSICGVAVNAYGLVQTTLPGGRPGYSFVGVISTEFTPAIALPFGFSLDGVGGLIGIHRTVAEDAVRAAVWAHHVDGLLFPKDPVATAPQLLAALDTYFPAAPGRYVFGPLAKIGWSANLVVGEVALLLELPEPLRVLLIGEIQVEAPTEQPQLELHVSFDGGIDFGKKLAFFDASLHDSRITSYPIGGDLAFRYGWGDDAVFALALGGFNPHFQPPAAFPSLKRLSITISSSVARLEAQAYLALTSNTLQFGARVELTAGTGSFNVHGWLGFDALCERDPLSFEFDLSAGVDLRAGTDVLASVHLDGTLSGPTPWHVAGRASLSLLFFDVTVHFDKQWGSAAAAVAVADPLPVLVAALADRSSWTGLPAAGVRAAIAPVGVPSDAGDAVLLDPAATLRLAQRAVPLDQRITRFGGASLGRTESFSIDLLTVFGTPTAPSSTATEEFAPAQFIDLTDAEKLSLPSFDRFDAGVEVGGDAVDLGTSARTRAVLTPIAYDTTILDSKAPPRAGARFLPSVVAVLGLNNSADGPAPGLGRYGPPVGAPPRVTLAPDRWVVASTSDLGVRADLSSDGSKLGAHLALQQHLSLNPGDAGALQVVLAEEAA